MISICMAVYNGEKYIMEQIISILKQISEKDELVISDDGSTDKTIEIIKALKDKRIKLIKNKSKYSITSNFENAILNSKGEYIFLADQDDIWMDNKVKIMMKYLLKFDLVVSDAIIVDENLNLMHPSAFELFKSRNGVLKNIIVNSYYGSCMAFKRRILKKILPFPRNREVTHDLWIGIISAMCYKVYFLKTPLIYYRRHKNTVTKSGYAKSERKLYKKIFGRIIIVKELMKFIIKKYK